MLLSTFSFFTRQKALEEMEGGEKTCSWELIAEKTWFGIRYRWMKKKTSAKNNFAEIETKTDWKDLKTLPLTKILTFFLLNKVQFKVDRDQNWAFLRFDLKPTEVQ